MRAAPGDGVHLAPPPASCSSGAADSSLTFLFPVAPASLCLCLRVALETILPEQEPESVLCFFSVRSGRLGPSRKCGCGRAGNPRS